MRIPLLTAQGLLLLASIVDGFQFMKNWKLPTVSEHADAIQERFGNKKLVVLTGAESELGQATAKKLLETGDYHVIGGVASGAVPQELSSSEDFTSLECNLDSFHSVREFCDKVNEFRLSKPLDRLVCHAGTSSSNDDNLEWSQDGHERTLQSQFLSPFLMTGLLLDGMEDSADARLTLVCPPATSSSSSGNLKDLQGFRAGMKQPVCMADGSTTYDPKKSIEDAKLCQQLLTNFLHEKYHKLNHVTFNDYQGGEEEGLFQVLHDPQGAQKSGISWTYENEKLAEVSSNADDKSFDIDTAYKLFHLSEKVTNAEWPKIKVVTSPCPTLKVIGAVTKAQVQKQELKRMRELGRPGISEPEVISRVTKRQKIAAAADRVVSFILRNTVQRAGKAVSSKVLGEFPEEALTGSFGDDDDDAATETATITATTDAKKTAEQEEETKEEIINGPFGNISEQDMKELERKIFAQMSKEAASKKLKTDKKLVVLTGASSGLGRKTALALLRSGEYHVIGAVRDLDKMEAVAEVDGFDMENFTPMYCEMNSFESVRQFCQNVEEFRGDKPIDRLICNAGVYQPSLRYAKWSKDGHEQTMQINFLSHFLMISKMIKSMDKSEDPRVTMVGSVTGNDNTVGGGGVYPIADLHDLDGFKAGFGAPIEMADGYGFIGAKAYKDSKLCLMILANFLHAKYHKSTGIAFSSMYPGCIAESPLFREKRAWFRAYFPIFMKFITGGFVGEHEAGQRLFQVAHDPRCVKSGVYWSWNGGPREGRGAEALEKEGQISGGGGAGGGWDSIFENDQSGKVLNIDTGFKLFEYATKITGAEWPGEEESHKITVADVEELKVDIQNVLVQDSIKAEQKNATASFA